MQLLFLYSLVEPCAAYNPRDSMRESRIMIPYHNLDYSRES